MRCPVCHAPAISFSAWCDGKNWRRYRCPHCGATLVANQRTVALAVLCLALVPLYIFLSNRVCVWGGLNEHAWGRIICGAWMIAGTGLIAGYTWRTGSYAVAEESATGIDASSKTTRRDLLLATALVAIAFAVYAPALRGDWLWDDKTLILHSPAIHSASGLRDVWRVPINGTEYLPVTSSVEWIGWHLWGARTLGYHLLSVLLHAMSGLLVWRILSQLGLRQGWLGGLLFVLHPLGVESVAWISELKNTVSLPPLLLAISCWLKNDAAPSPERYRRAFAWFLLSLLAKPTGLMLPFVLLLFAWHRRGRIRAGDALSTLPFFVASGAFGFLAASLTRHVAAAPIAPLSAAARLATAGWQGLFLFGKCVLPIHLLTLYPEEIVKDPSLLDLVPWLILGALIFCLWWLRRDKWDRAVLLSAGFIVLNLAPAVGFIAANAPTMVWSLDHLAYIPLVGVAGLFAAACEAIYPRLSRDLRRAGRGALAFSLVMLGAATSDHASDFADAGKLWAGVLVRNPNSAIAHHNLGIYLLDHQRTLEAADEFRAALRLKPDYPSAHNGLGNALVFGGKVDAAAGEYRAAVASDPHYAEAHNGLANILLQAGQLQAARAEVDKALEDKPHYVEARCNLGLIDAQEGRLLDAVEEFETAHELRPDDPRIAQELDALRAANGNSSR